MSGVLDLDRRIALITGAGQGIGRQVALHLAQHNAGGIIVNDYVLGRAQEVAAEVQSLGCRALAVQADITDLAAVKDMVSRGTAEFGAVDVLVNNAGSAGATPTPDARDRFWEV